MLRSSSLVVAVIALTLSTQAQAKEVASETLEIPAQETRLRNNQGTLGSAKRTGLSARPKGVSAKPSHEENRIVSAKPLATGGPVISAQKSPYELAFDSLKSHAATIDPSITARGEISFVVGKGGVPTRIQVFGFSSTLDAAFARHLQTLKFPSGDVGQFYTSKLTVQAVAKTKPAPARKARPIKKARRN